MGRRQLRVGAVGGGMGWSPKCPKVTGRPVRLCCGSCLLDCSKKLQQFSFVVKEVSES